jgi:hypothetical protein
VSHGGQSTPRRVRGIAFGGPTGQGRRLVPPLFVPSQLPGWELGCIGGQISSSDPAFFKGAALN